MRVLCELASQTTGKRCLLPVGHVVGHVFTGEPLPESAPITSARTGTPPLVPDPGFAEWAQEWLDDRLPDIEGKAKVYGSNSLAAMGHLFARAGHMEIPQSDALEYGCGVYAYGKMERVMDAMLRGELPGADTWGDIAVYALMALYTRSKGTWP